MLIFFEFETASGRSGAYYGPLSASRCRRSCKAIVMPEAAPYGS